MFNITIYNPLRELSFSFYLQTTDEYVAVQSFLYMIQFLEVSGCKDMWAEMKKDGNLIVKADIG